MTRKELKEEAEEKAGVYFDSLDIDHGNVSDTPFSAYDVFVAYEKGALDFAEPREKRIEELEARCNELFFQVNEKIANITDQEKENKQLKTRLRKKINVTTVSDYPYSALKLEEAKQLLKKWVELFKPKLEGYPITPIQEQTEQFLNNLEK